jgi:hypothetical protein
MPQLETAGYATFYVYQSDMRVQFEALTAVVKSCDFWDVANYTALYP